ncbi:MAG: urea ABC transporter substrate-binding protein [Isosphaeraceae bacterium]|nr:urea ABC transporter substrate-binding protein [Isosphaeraceae bacterium]
MRRAWLWGLSAVLVIAAVAGSALSVFGRVDRPIVVGILHSETGPKAISEKSMIHAEIMAIEEINARGGLLGRRLKPVIADGRSDWPTYAQQARKLIDDDHVSVIFGCWTSASRKNVRPVVEEKDHLLVYPMAYEGLEESPNIVYTGATANQQVIPAVTWSHDVLKAKRVFLVGSDYIWPHTVNAIIKDQLRALRLELVGEDYIFFGSADVDDVIAEIVKAKPDVIFSTVVGDSNLAFYDRLRRAGVKPDQSPVISFSIAEDELRVLASADTVGHYAAWNYFQSIDRLENQEYVRRFKARYGADRVTSDVITAAYNSVYLWAQAVTEADTEEVGKVRQSILRQSLNAPEGVIAIDRETQHTWRPFYLAKMRADGQFEIVYTTQKPVQPVPYPFGRSRSEWDAFLNGLYAGWGNQWANPVKKPKSTPSQ